MSEIPLVPSGKKDIHRLETVLLVETLLRPDVIEKIRNPEERLTWVDSLAVAAAALAREKAGKPVSEIADEIGRTEATIRRHLKGETEAGKLVRETYEMLARGKRVAGELKVTVEAPEVEKKVKELEEKINSVKKGLEELKNKLESLLASL